MGHHRADLTQQLDHVLSQLDLGVEYFKQHNPALDEDGLQRGKNQYQKLRETLLETNAKAISGIPRLIILPLCILTPTLGSHRIPCNTYACTPFPVPLVSWHSPLDLYLCFSDTISSHHCLTCHWSEFSSVFFGFLQMSVCCWLSWSLLPSFGYLFESF